MISKVTKIINPEGRTGFNQKTNKQWTSAEVELDNGDRTFIFQPINVGDEVESYESEGKDKEGNPKTYTNWRRTSSRPASQMEQVVVNMLKAIEDIQQKHGEKLDEIYKVVSGNEFTSDEVKVDEIETPMSQEEIDSIPF